MTTKKNSSQTDIAILAKKFILAAEKCDHPLRAGYICVHCGEPSHLGSRDKAATAFYELRDAVLKEWKGE